MAPWASLNRDFAAPIQQGLDYGGLVVDKWEPRELSSCHDRLTGSDVSVAHGRPLHHKKF